MKAAIIVGAMALITYLCRALPLLSLANSARLPAWVKQRLEYVAPAILAAMVAPEIVMRDGAPSLQVDLLAYALCLVTALTTRRLFPPILLGMAVLLGLQLLPSP